MNVLIIEDEYPASGRLERLLKEIDEDIRVLSILQSVEDSVNWFSQNELPDLIFLDIQLEDGLCFDIYEKIKINTPIIFTTAFDNYAIKAFQVNSVDYLLKPIEKEGLEKAILKYRELHENNYSEKIEEIIKSLKPHTKERFLVKVGEHYRSIPVSNINCFYIEERCNFILTMEGKNYAIDYSLDKAESVLDTNIFFRVNRNFLVHLNAIRDIVAFSSNRLKLRIDKWQGRDDILVSRERVRSFKKWMDR